MYNKIRTAIVTGGARGIGRAICERLSADGIYIVVADLDLATATVVAEANGGEAVDLDVSDEAAMAALIERIESERGAVDLFVSNAGVLYGDGPDGAASRASGLGKSDDRWLASWNINVMPHVYAARALLPRMRQRGFGAFLNIASAAGLLAQIGDASYSVSKHAAVAFAESLAITHGDEGIHVTVVCPQAVQTRMLEDAIDHDGDAPGGGLRGADIDGIVSPEHVAECAVAGLQKGQFLVLPHPGVADYVKLRAADPERWLSGMRKLKQKLFATD